MNSPSMESCYESEGFTAFACSIEKIIVRTDNGYPFIVSDVSFSLAVKPLTDFHIIYFCVIKISCQRHSALKIQIMAKECISNLINLLLDTK
jgi:hypothetical protein